MNNFKQEYAKIMDERRHNSEDTGLKFIAGFALIGIIVIALVMLA